MVSPKRLNNLCLIAASTTVLLAAGCSHQPPSESDTASSGAEITETARLENTQTAAGARAECTLYSDHFDGVMLSSLGTNALDLLLSDSHGSIPLVIYMAVPEDDKFSEDRRLTVGHYLEDRGGLKADQIEFRTGGNPASNSPAVIGLTNYGKTDTGEGSSSSSTGH